MSKKYMGSDKGLIKLIELIKNLYNKHTHVISNVDGLQSALDGKAALSHEHDSRYYTESEIDTKLNSKLNTSLKGSASGLAELDSNGKVPSAQLPSFVDDVIEGYLYNGKFYKESAHATVITGESGKIYIDLATEKTYRWSGSAFAIISDTLALGETSTTAYRGDRGKTAYDHSQSAHAPTNAQANVIETVKVNGTALTLSSKAVNITVPTNNNQLTNGAGYITSSGTAKTISDTLPISKGGTGQTTGINAANALINSLSTGDSTPTDNDYYVSQYVNGGTTNTTYHRRPMSALWSYIKSKLATVATSGSYNDLSNKPTIPSVGNGTITIKQAGTTKGTFTMNQSGNTTIELTDNNTTYSSKSAASGGTDVSLVTTGEKYTWNNKANASHGNHVPATQTANNAVFLRNDNTWQTVTPANIGAAASSHTHSAYVNQNAFSNVVVGSTTVAADSATDTLTLVAGSNVTITPDATNDKITISATDTNTWRGIQNNLTSDSTSDSLSAAQGKVLKGLIDGKAASSHTHTKSQITDFPTSLPASDVYSWAKASSKPTYNGTELKVGGSGTYKDSTVESAISTLNSNLNGTRAAFISDENGAWIKIHKDVLNITNVRGDAHRSIAISDVIYDGNKSMKNKLTSLENANKFNISNTEIDTSKNEVVLILYAHNYNINYGIDTLTIPMSKITSGSINRLYHVVHGQDEYTSSFYITISTSGKCTVDMSSTNPYYVPSVEIYVK